MRDPAWTPRSRPPARTLATQARAARGPTGMNAYKAHQHYLARITATKRPGARAATAGIRLALVRDAQCMPTRGIPMVDPNAVGQLNLGNVPRPAAAWGSYAPQFHAADLACRRVHPRLGQRQPHRTVIVPRLAADATGPAAERQPRHCASGLGGVSDAPAPRKQSCARRRPAAIGVIQMSPKRKSARNARDVECDRPRPAWSGTRSSSKRGLRPSRRSGATCLRQTARTSTRPSVSAGALAVPELDDASC